METTQTKPKIKSMEWLRVDPTDKTLSKGIVINWAGLLLGTGAIAGALKLASMFETEEMELDATKLGYWEKIKAPMNLNTEMCTTPPYHAERQALGRWQSLTAHNNYWAWPWGVITGPILQNEYGVPGFYSPTMPGDILIAELGKLPVTVLEIDRTGIDPIVKCSFVTAYPWKDDDHTIGTVSIKESCFVHTNNQAGWEKIADEYNRLKNIILELPVEKRPIAAVLCNEMEKLYWKLPYQMKSELTSIGWFQKYIQDDLFGNNKQ